MHSHCLIHLTNVCPFVAYFDNDFEILFKWTELIDTQQAGHVTVSYHDTAIHVSIGFRVQVC